MSHFTSFWLTQACTIPSANSYTNLYNLCISLNLGYTWENIKDKHGHCLIVGQYCLTKKTTHGFIASNKCWDVFAAMELITKLLLEEYSVHDSHSRINDSLLMKLIKLSSKPDPDHPPINNNSFGRMNNKFVCFFINMLSLQLVFDNWYVSTCICILYNSVSIILYLPNRIFLSNLIC